MIRKWWGVIGLGVSALAFAPAGAASENGTFSVGVKAGTTGLGVEAAMPLTSGWNVRAALNGFDYDSDFEEDGIDYDGTLRLQSVSLMADWHVFGGAFRVSPGLFVNRNELRGKAEGSLDIGNDTYEGRLDATVDWRTLAPYLGIGWGDSFRGGRVTVSADLGVMFTGSPSVRLRGEELSGTVDPGVFEEDLRREEASLKDALRDAKYYPVATLGISYRF